MSAFDDKRSRGSDTHRRQQAAYYLQTAGVSRPTRRKKNSNSQGWLKRLAPRAKWMLSEEAENLIICLLCAGAFIYMAVHAILASAGKGAM